MNVKPDLFYFMVLLSEPSAVIITTSFNKVKWRRVADAYGISGIQFDLKALIFYYFFLFELNLINIITIKRQ